MTWPTVASVLAASDAKRDAEHARQVAEENGDDRS